MLGVCKGSFVAGVAFGAAEVYETVAANVSNVAVLVVVTGLVLATAPCSVGFAAAPAADWLLWLLPAQ